MPGMNAQSPFGDAAAHAASSDELALSDQLAKKVAVVTGSTQGLGLRAVEIMMKRSLKGAVICGRNYIAGRATAERLTNDRQRVIYQRADLRDLDDCARVIARAIEEFGTLDILVNSAGITDRGGILDATADLWQQTFDVNARAPFFLMQAASRHFIECEKPGTIVNVASITAHGGVPALTVYAASKAALVAITKNAAYSLARNGIRVNTLAVGWMDTPAEDVIQKRFHSMPDGWQQQAGGALPAGRLLNMNEVARWIVYLASTESGIISGSVIDFDHGVIGCYDATPVTAEKAGLA